MSARPTLKIVAGSLFKVGIGLPKHSVDLLIGAPDADLREYVSSNNGGLDYLHPSEQHIAGIEEGVRSIFRGRISESRSLKSLACDLKISRQPRIELGIHKTPFSAADYLWLNFDGELLIEADLAPQSQYRGVTGQYRGVADAFQLTLEDADILSPNAETIADIDLTDDDTCLDILQEYLLDLGLLQGRQPDCDELNPVFKVTRFRPPTANLLLDIDVPESGGPITKLLRLPYERYSGLEANPVTLVGTDIEAVSDPNDAAFWSVYGRHKNSGLAECVLDVRSERDASQLLSWMQTYVKIRGIDLSVEKPEFQPASLMQPR